MQSVPNVRARLSVVLGREVEGHEKQADILVELLERLEEFHRTAGQKD